MGISMIDFCLNIGPHDECLEWLPLVNQLESLFPEVHFEQAELGPHGENGFIVTNYSQCECQMQIIEHMQTNGYNQMISLDENILYFSTW